MCDTGKPIEFTPGLPKELLPLFKNMAGKMESGISNGATPYNLPLPGSAPMDPGQLQARNMISAMMGQRYNPTFNRYQYTPGGAKPQFDPYSQEGGSRAIGPIGAPGKIRSFKDWVVQQRNPKKNA